MKHIRASNYYLRNKKLSLLNNNSNKNKVNSDIKILTEIDDSIYNYNYIIKKDENDEKYIIITKYTGSKKIINIPEYINDIKVTQIGSGSNILNEDVISIIIPNTITTIYDGAFMNSSLKNINIRSSINKLGKSSFYNCTNLDEVYINCENLITLEPNTFYNCINLTNVYLTEGLQNIESNCFKNCTSLNKIIIPSSVNNIDETAFEGCTELNL
jgi:hypothetical protein